MRQWLRRVGHAVIGEKALLAASLVVALIVTALQDIPERAWYGHELGVFVQALAFAYAGAWIFNWVINVRPRAQQLRDIYRLTWQTLSFAAWDGYYLVKDVQYLANADPRVEPADEDILALCRRITFGRENHGFENPVEYFNDRLQLRNRWLGAVNSLLAYAEHDLLVALAEVNNSSLIVAPMQDFSEDDKPVMVHRVDGPPYPMNLANEARRISEYFAATERLRKCMEALKYAPGPVASGVEMSNTIMWEQNKLESLAAE